MMILLRFFLKKIDLLYLNKKLIRDHFSELVIWISVMDLSQTTYLLKSRYSSNSRGRKPRDPRDMLRSLLLMHKLQYTSVDKWECPNPCSDSSYGRTFHTSTKNNPRLFPRVKRDSKEWRKRYALRTGAERCIKRQKVDYNLEGSNGQSSRHWNIYHRHVSADRCLGKRNEKE